MDITFTHKKKKLPVSINVPGNVALYTVPAGYSEDG